MKIVKYFYYVIILIVGIWVGVKIEQVLYKPRHIIDRTIYKTDTLVIEKPSKRDTTISLLGKINWEHIPPISVQPVEYLNNDTLNLIKAIENYRQLKIYTQKNTWKFQHINGNFSIYATKNEPYIKRKRNFIEWEGLNIGIIKSNEYQISIFTGFQFGRTKLEVGIQKSLVYLRFSVRLF